MKRSYEIFVCINQNNQDSQCSGSLPRFSASVQIGSGTHTASCTRGTASMSRGQAAEAWRWPPNSFKRRG